jgi:hypothetical protein
VVPVPLRSAQELQLAPQASQVGRLVFSQLGQVRLLQLVLVSSMLGFQLARQVSPVAFLVLSQVVRLTPQVALPAVVS